MLTSTEIVARMHNAVPPGRRCLTDLESRRLTALTQELLASYPAARAEYARFLAAAQKGIGLADSVVAERLAGKRILVTGGTGCIGSALIAQLCRFRPDRVVSVSRGIAQGWPRHPGAEYLHADIRDPGAIAAIFQQQGFDVVFHVAGQRDPGLAEAQVHRTVTTNVLGTCNVVDAASQAGAASLVFASTGKALRPYSSEVYTASKRAAEWVVSRAVGYGQATCGAARFTHVIDNSIIHARVLEWCDGSVIRLHGSDIAFYVQSALQSAQLLLAAEAGARYDSLRVHALRDIGWPVSLLDMALGVLARTGSAAPVYFSGYDRGYEASPFPGLYDPLTATDVSPLISAFEAVSTEASWCPAVDAFPLRIAPVPILDEQLQALAATCARTAEPGPVRAALDELSWGLFDATMSAVPRPALIRAVQLSKRHRGSLDPAHERMLAVIEHHATSPEPVSWQRPPAVPALGD